jgi:hypothetical protein
VKDEKEAKALLHNRSDIIQNHEKIATASREKVMAS